MDASQNKWGQMTHLCYGFLKTGVEQPAPWHNLPLCPLYSDHSDHSDKTNIVSSCQITK